MTNDDNWVIMAPALDVGGNTLIFGATMGGVLTPDVADSEFFNIGAITFTNADGNYTIRDLIDLGGSFSFADAGSITNDSGFLQTIDVDLIATGSNFFITAVMQDINIGGTINLSDTGGVLLTVGGLNATLLGGTISGSGGSLLKIGAGTLTLNGANSYGGGTELAAGTIIIGDDSALGTGDLTVTGDSALEAGATVDADNDISINDMVTLTLSGDNDFTLSGFIEGDGALTIDMDAGIAVTLDRANTYEGGTTLMGGTVVLSSNLALSTGDVHVIGDTTVESDGTNRLLRNNYEIDAATTLTFAGIGFTQLNATLITGDGLLGVNMTNDDDVLTLRSENTYTGGTTLTRGTIRLEDDDALGTGTLTLAGDGSLHSNSSFREFDNDIDTDMFALTLGGNFQITFTDLMLSGMGGLIIDTGIESVEMTLTDTVDGSMFTGLTEVNNGGLILNGTVAGSVDVNDGGTLRGTGSILGMTSNLTINSGGMVSPGDPVGTLTVEGNYTQEMDGIYAVTLDADDLTSGLLDVSGTATFESGSIIEASIVGVGYIPSDMDFIILDADGGITDNGVGAPLLDSDSVTVELVNNPANPIGNTWALQLLRATDAYSIAASAGNNTSIGLALDSLIGTADMTPSGTAGQLLGQLDVLDSTTYNQAVAGLSPEPLNAMTITGVENNRVFTTEQAIYLSGLRSGTEARPVPGPPPGSMALANNDPLILAAAIAQRDAAPTQMTTGHTDDDPRWNQYFKVQGAFINQDTTQNRTGFTADTFGGQIGLDYKFTNNFVAGLALGYSYTDVDLNQGLGNIQDQTVRAGPYMSYYKDDWYLDGSFTFGWHFYDSDRTNPAIPDMEAHANYNGYDLTGYLGTGYHFMLGWDTYLTPIGSLLYSHFSYESYTESGNLGMPLSIPSWDSNSLRSRLGVNLSYRLPEMSFRPVPYLYLGWEHEFLKDDPIQASFAAGGDPFTVNVGSRATDSFFIGGGVNLLVNETLSAFIRIEGVTASTTGAVGAAAGVSIAF